MTKDEIFNKVKQIIIDELDGVDEDKITVDASFEADLGADSLDAIEIVCGLEEEFGLSISDEDTMDFKTVKSVIDYIEEHL